MIYLRKANERGQVQIMAGWTPGIPFPLPTITIRTLAVSSALRVINDDVIEAGQGFGHSPS